MRRGINIVDVCFVCRRRTCGLGTGGHGYRPKVGWLCSECANGMYGARAFAMTDRQFDEYEQRAILRAGEEAGAYLDGIGRTDLASLSDDQWRGFLGTFIHAFGHAVRDEVGRGAIQGWAEEQLHAHRSTQELQDDEVPVDG